MARGYFVTGTDTGVGKTTFAVVLIHALRERGLQVAAMKPVAAGCEWREGQLKNDDVIALSAAANVKANPQLMNPYAFVPPIAPHIAAAQAGVAIKLNKIMSAYTALSTLADVVVVEGVGGFRVPLGVHLDTAELARALDLPIVLVVGMRLGCVNHALLTAEAITTRGLIWGGWVANILEPDMPALDENILALQTHLPAPYLGKLSRKVNPRHIDTVTAYSLQWNDFPE